MGVREQLALPWPPVGLARWLEVKARDLALVMDASESGRGEMSVAADRAAPRLGSNLHRAARSALSRRVPLVRDKGEGAGEGA